VLNGGVRLYAVGKRAEEIRQGKDPKEIRPTNADALEFYELLESGIQFHGVGTTALNELRDYLKNLDLIGDY